MTTEQAHGLSHQFKSRYLLSRQLNGSGRIKAFLVFAKLKALLRKIAARSVEALWTAIGQLLGAFAPGECINYIRHSGYVRSL